MHKEHNLLSEQNSLIIKNINLVLQIFEESKVQQNKSVQNSDYIKEEVGLIHKNLDSLTNISAIKKEALRPTSSLKDLDQEFLKIKNLLEEVKTLVLS